MTSDELFERHLRPLREKHGAGLWRILAALVERQIWTMPADLFQAYQADPARAEADLLPKYRIVYLARHSVAALPRAVSSRRARATGGDKRGKQVSEGRAPVIERVRTEDVRLRALGRKERDITAAIANKLNIRPDRVRRIRREIKASSS